MISFKRANQNDLRVVESLAKTIWPPTFKDILSNDQIEYMLDLMYSVESLTKQLTELNHRFFLVQENNSSVGYFSYELNYKGKPTTKIHKLYLLPKTQGKGYGRKMIEEIKGIAKSEGQTSLSLNVNRFNQAYQFYLSLGFSHVDTVDIPIGSGFLMEDYVLELNLG